MTRFLSIALSTVVLLALAAPSLIAGTIQPLSDWMYRWGDSPVAPDGSLSWLDDALDAPGWTPAERTYDPGGGKQTDWLWLRARLPEDIAPPAAVSIPGTVMAFEVYVGDRLIYTSGTFGPKSNPYSHVNIHIVPLPENSGGGVLTLRIYSDVSTIGVRAPEADVSVGAQADLIVWWTRASVGQLVVGGISIFIGLVVLFAFGVRRRERVWIALALGLFCLLVGTFYAATTHLAPLVLGSASLTFYLRSFTFILFPIALYAFIEHVVAGSRVIRALWIVHAAYAAVVIPADLLGPLQLATLWQVTQGLLAVTLVIAIYAGARAARRGNVEARILLVGLTIAAVTGIHDILRGLSVPVLSNWLSHYGQLVFICVLAYIVNRRFTESHRLLRDYSRQLEEKSEQLEEYAHTLEDRVTERTRDLDRKNRELERAFAELRDTQQQLVMREKMASLGDLVAGVAHEVNNPIGAVHSAADASRRGIEIVTQYFEEHPCEEATSGRLGKGLRALSENNVVITTASQRVADIVRSLKNFSRLDEAEFQKADIHAGLDSTLTLVRHKLKNRIEVVREYGRVPEIDCYPNQLNQVFMNVLVNAAQAIDGEGTITIRTHRDDGNVVIDISDTGRGISSEHLDRVFDPGFTTKGVGVGTGLGLSISYKIIAAHDGSISVKSEVGAGTTFTIRLPIDADEPASGPA